MELTTRDYRLIREAVYRHFTIEQIEEEALLDRPVDAAFRRELADIDLRFFCRFYLPHHFTAIPSQMHEDAFDMIEAMMGAEGRENAAIVMPRGHAKTTIATLGFPAWCVCTGKRRHILILSDTEPQAKEQLGTLKFELESNDRIKEDFGDLKGPKWQEAIIETSNTIRIAGLGAGMKVRGRKFHQWRPDLIILDDIEDLQSVQSDLQRERLATWFKRSVVRAGWRDTKILMVGNFLHYGCLLKEVADNPMFRSVIYKAIQEWPERMDLWEGEWRSILTDLTLSKEGRASGARKFYEQNRAEMDKGAVVNWPDGFPLYDLMAIRVSEGEAAFSMELQNDPIDPSKALFKAIKYYRSYWADNDVWLEPLTGAPAVALKSCRMFGFTDPSMGSTAQGDFSAILVGAVSPVGQIFILEADLQRRTPDSIMADQITWHRQYRFVRYGIEKNSFQALFATESARRSLEAEDPIPIIPVQQTANKVMRIQSLEPDLTNGYILLNVRGQELLKKQLLEFPLSSFDDGPDALEGLRTLARMYQMIQSAEVVQSDAHQFGKVASAPGAHRTSEKDPYEVYEEAFREETGKEESEVFVPQMFA